jgi:hypothetical protein
VLEIVLTPKFLASYNFHYFFYWPGDAAFLSPTS